jgi:hypothetical protein
MKKNPICIFKRAMFTHKKFVEKTILGGLRKK